jgi:hypothetical protein
VCDAADCGILRSPARHRHPAPADVARRRVDRGVFGDRFTSGNQVRNIGTTEATSLSPASPSDGVVAVDLGRLGFSQGSVQKLGGQAAIANCGPGLETGPKRWPSPDPSAPL